MNINYVYLDDRIREDDLHKAVEAQGRIAIGEVKALLDDILPEDRRVAILDRLDVLRAMLGFQGDPTRDCRDMSLYRDGSPVFRLVPDGTADVEARDYLGEADEEFDYHIGELAEHLSTGVPGCRVEVNDPPVEEPGVPGLLLALLRERRG